MGAAYFYHLTRQPLEQALPRLLELSLARGWRVALRGRQDRRMDWLDQKLWLGDDQGFLPHGLAGGPHDALQPVLLTTTPDRPNAAACVMSVDGAEITPDEVRSLERCCILFDGGDATALERARAQWRDLTAAGCAAQYWSDESGSWQKKSERPQS
ncbi:DNA polymerase III subunit chi [Pseudooceanicola sp. 216_PA32_1]|uniref:DNA polymerase III subunit chi n=1 Tax=Pseudooceanicola pacificus TaxID=2676438 RepID=A0A844WCQ5_9RHOB|nr:DNA polymerase III subunit chi [Pseudooceanicola pacificus]MWB77360.1 DNA polymerase III subunit chi [Pseudooceanicola pacificus]